MLANGGAGFRDIVIGVRINLVVYHAPPELRQDVVYSHALVGIAPLTGNADLAELVETLIQPSRTPGKVGIEFVRMMISSQYGWKQSGPRIGGPEITGFCPLELCRGRTTRADLHVPQAGSSRRNDTDLRTVSEEPGLLNFHGQKRSNDTHAPRTDHHEKAITLARAHGFGFYGALIIAAALISNSTAWISEDLQHGRTIEGLIIESPFAAR